MIDEIDFSKKYEYSVDIRHDKLGEFGKGSLSFGENNRVRLGFKNHFQSNLLSDGKMYQGFKAFCDDGKCFTLFNCKYWGFHIYAEFIITDEVTNSFKQIHIRYSDVSDWFFQWQQIEGTIGEALTWKNKAKDINVNIITPQEQFSLTSASVTSFSKSGEDQTIHEHVSFIFERANGKYTFDDTRTKALELSTLLSILIAQPLSIVSMEVVTEDDKFHCAYFPSYKKSARNSPSSEFSHICFTPKAILDDRWQSIFESYYKSKLTKKLWPRLSGMQRYDGFWEFKILGYVSLLDRFVSLHAKQTELETTKVPDEKKIKFNEILNQISPTLTTDQSKGIMDGVASIFSERISFQEQYKHAVNGTDNDIVKIIEISDEDFKLIKKVRDGAAHGTSPDLKDADSERIHAIVDKIALLLTYWAFKDFGLTSQDFIKCLNFTHNHLRWGSMLNSVHLDRASGAKFFTISKEQFDKISNINPSIGPIIFTQEKLNGIEYSEELSEKIKKWRLDNLGFSGQIPMDEIFNVNKEQIEYLGNAYYQYEEGSTKPLKIPFGYVIKEI